MIEGFRNQGQEVITPFNMSPVDRQRTPLQQEMNRPEVILSRPGGQKMVTFDRSLESTASPTPQVQAAVQSAAQPMSAQQLATAIPRITPMQVTPAQAESNIPVNRLIGGQQTEMGQGVMQPGMDREKMMRDAKVAKDVLETGDESLIERAKSYFGSRENMLRLAMAFNTMRLEPDQGLARALGDELKDVRSTQLARSERNRTAAYFDSVDPKISAAIRNGLSAKDAIALFREQQKGVVVGKMIVNPTTGTVIYDGSQEGSELPATYRALQLRAEAAGLVPGTEAYSQFMINGGQRAGLSVKTNPDGTFEITEGGATGSGRAMTESQAKALTFSQRMEASQRILGTVEQEGTSIFNSIVSNVPFAGNLLTSPEYKLYDQAKRDFVNAILRFESGAAIAASEFANADVQYFPQPGDTEAVIRQKRNNRDLAIAVMKRSAGPDQEAYAKNIRVDIFGPRAENWPEVGTIEDHPYKQGVKVRYIGGDPELPENFEEVK